MFLQEYVDILRVVLRLADDVVLLQYFRSWICCVQYCLLCADALYSGLAAIERRQLGNKCLANCSHKLMFASSVFKFPLKIVYK